MKALILAAGLGTRLKHLTANNPKALVEVSGKPLLEIVVDNLKKSGIMDIIINVHHFAEQIVDFVKLKNNFGINIEISDETSLLLDTGGGIKKASWFFEGQKDFLVHNVDVISGIDFQKMYKFHSENNSFATLAVKKRDTARYFLFDSNNELCGWENIKENNRLLSKSFTDSFTQLAFSGIQILSTEIIKYLVDTEPNSITHSYLALSKTNKVIAYPHDSDYWFDLGRPENIAEAENFFKNNNINI